MVQQKTLIVKGKHNGFRIDQFLVEAVFPWEGKRPGRKEIQAAIENGLVTVDGKVVRSSHRVKPGESVSFTENDQAKNQKKTAFPKISVLFENDAFLILNKPAGLTMHPARVGQTGTLTDWILEQYPALAKIGEDPLRPGMVHRLDKDTSGVLVLAKTKKSFTALKRLFQGRKVEKTYTALVYGRVKEEKGSIDTPLGRIKGGIRRGTEIKKRAFAGEMREAHTEYHLLTAYPQHTLLSIKPKTGRTHQIRVHLASIGHPVVGDLLYQFKIHRKDALLPPHQLLHASNLAFTLSKEGYAFEAPLPSYFRTALKGLDGK